MRSAFAAPEDITESWRRLCEGGEVMGLRLALESLVSLALNLRCSDVRDAGVGIRGGSGGVGSFLFTPLR